MASLPSLAGESWLNAEPLQHLLSVLSSNCGQARIAGGAVRNALLGEAIEDIDIATTLLPKEVLARARDAGMRVHATGLSHGTVTVVAHTHKKAFVCEVTTLRIDTETDGRRATVEFTDDWHADAARRDFTINALYCDADGTVHDPLGGYPDLAARRVRFVGNPHDRIIEDYLRILRYFRFHARFGNSEIDAPALQACIDHRAGLSTLSGERICMELFKLLVATGVVETVRLMDRVDIFQYALPAELQIARLERMCLIDSANDLVPDAELRLAALVDPRTAPLDRLRLSNQQHDRLNALMAESSPTPALRDAERKIVLYQIGADRFRDAVRYRWALSSDDAGDGAWSSLLRFADDWPVPVFPVSGQDLIERGFAPGSHVGEKLRTLEDWWMAAGFPNDKAKILAQLQD